MTVKDKTLQLLEENRGTFLSGEEIAEKTGCTRGAVWKAVKSLQEEKYPITAVTNKGYCLDESTDILSEPGVRKYLSGKAKDLDISVYKSLESTNITLREFADKGAAEGKVVISGMQTKGRGRLGRSFFSPSDTGIYLSILLRPDIPADKAVKMTTAAAVAVSMAIEKVSDLKPSIKWVNDVYLRGKKICGILTEAAFSSMEVGGLEYAVVGIGVNVYQPEGGFSEELKNIAGEVFTEKMPDMRNRLAAEILNYYIDFYYNLESNTFFEDYHKRLMWINEKINVISAKKSTPATLLGIDTDCRLHVKYEDGREDFVSSGEISIRKA